MHGLAKNLWAAADALVKDGHAFDWKRFSGGHYSRGGQGSAQDERTRDGDLRNGGGPAVAAT